MQTNKKLSSRIGWWIYYFFQAVRYTILRSGTGVVSHCKHDISCGEFTVRAIQKEGWLKGLPKGIVRIWNCR